MGRDRGLMAGRAIVAVGLMGGLMGGLAGCAPADNEFAPACPQAALLPGAGDVVRYRPNAAGRDLTDLEFRGRVVSVSGKCQPGPNSHTVDATVKVTIQLNRGPALPTRNVAVTYFVAVARGDDILDKHVYTNQVTFPANLDQIWLEGDPVFMRLPVTPTVSGAAYTVWVGFQLTPQEMAASRGP